MERTKYVIKSGGMYYRGGLAYEWTINIREAYKYDFMTFATRDAILVLHLTEFSVEGI